MKYWKCIGNEFNKYFTIDKIYSTDDNGYEIKDDKNDKYPTKVTEMCSATFEEIKEEGENKMEDLRELIKPCYLVKIRDGRTLIALECEDIIIEFYDINNINSAIIDIDSFDYNLDSDSCRNYDIIEVYGLSSSLLQKSTELRGLIWKRTEISPTQLKLEELEKKQREIADEMEKLRREL